MLVFIFRSPKHFKRVCTLALCSIATGCATPRPSVLYTKIEGDGKSTAAANLTDHYYLQQSVVTIAQSKGALGGKDAYTVTSSAVEYPNFKIGIASHSTSLGTVDTTVNIAKYDGTDLVKSIGTKVADHRIDAIKDVESIITTAIPIAASTLFSADTKKQIGRQQHIKQTQESKPLPWKFGIPFQVDGDNSNDTHRTETGDQFSFPDVGVTITLKQVPPGAHPISELPSVASDYYVYASCRDAIVNIHDKEADLNYVYPIKVADPTHFETVGFPVSGAINMQSVCGVSVATDVSTGTSSTSEIVDAMGKAIGDLIKTIKQ